MSWIAKKDASILLNAGFTEEDLGFGESGMQGVEIFETPDDYFAHELITNACENGQCSLMDEPKAKDDFIKERYDDSRPGLYDDHEYDGNEDFTADVPVSLRVQCNWLKTIKLGKMSIWQRRNKNGNLEWPVKNIKVSIPEDDQDRFNKLPKDLQKELWKSYARDQWKNLWGICATSLREYEIEDNLSFIAKNNMEFNVLVISADNIRKMGYTNLPAEARWISMMYFIKDVK